MTEDELVDDLARLLREGLAYVECDPWDEDPAVVPRFAVTTRGRAELQATCDHKFIDSTWCLKCGWTPPSVGAVAKGRRLGTVDGPRA